MDYKVQNLLAAEELKSERVISIAQAVVVAILLFLYLISPKGFSPGDHVPFEPVKLLFFIYLPVLMARCLQIHFSKKISWMYYLYLAFDLIILTTLIFSFHIQYQQPFSLSLRAPTFVYYFIFIAIRCLSYDYLKVTFVGIFSSLCWAFMTYYALNIAQLQRTSQFARSLEKDSVILGMEVDKILVILVTTVICATVVYRKKYLLNQFSKNSLRGLQMERFIGREAFQALNTVNDLHPGQGTKKMAATMMIDLRGFSKISYQLPAEKVVSYLGQYHKIVATIIFKYGGSIDKYLGDGVLAHFGIITANPDFVANALRAAEEINSELEIWKNKVAIDGPYFDFGIAMSVGEVIFGAVGHEDRMEITVIGEVVNLSAKLEKHTKTIGYRVLTTVKMYDFALKQGFKPKLLVTHKNAEAIQGLSHTIDLVSFGESIPPT